MPRNEVKIGLRSCGAKTWKSVFETDIITRYQDGGGGEGSGEGGGREGTRATEQSELNLLLKKARFWASD